MAVTAKKVTAKKTAAKGAARGNGEAPTRGNGAARRKTDGAAPASTRRVSSVPPVVERVLADGQFAVERFVECFDVLVGAAGGTEKLRQLVFELAVRGRLSLGVTSAMGPPPVSAIDAEYARVCSRFGIRPNAETASPTPRWETPGTWFWTTLGRVFPISSGTTPSRTRSAYFGGPIAWVKTTDLNNGVVSSCEEQITQDAVTDCSLRIYPKGTVCVAMYGGAGTIGKSGLLGVESTINQSVCALLPNKAAAHPEYVHLFIKAIRAVWMDYAASFRVAGNINAGTVREMALPLPPLAEQKRIVARVDQLMALIDELEAKQTRKREVGSRFTQSALEALTNAEGPEEFDAAWKRVVENWETVLEGVEKVADLRLAVIDLASRGQLVRTDLSASGAEGILHARRSERRGEWERREREKLSRSGNAPRGDKWKSAYLEPDFEFPANLPPVPTTWQYAPIGLLGADHFAPVQTGPFGAQLHSSEFVPTGVPVIAVGNLTGTGFTTDGLYFVTKAKAAQLARYDVQAGDLLFARSGATLGKVCVAPEYVNDWRMTGHILRVRLDPRVLDAQLAGLWLWAAGAVKEQVLGTIRGGTRPGYNTALLENIVLPVPPRQEQQAILDRIGAIMKLCDELNSVLRRSEHQASMLVAAVVQEMVA